MTAGARPEPTDAPAPGSALEVLRVFLRLGLTSFGGPVAHLGYFRTEFVERRRWLGEAAYAERVALAQFLPGPTSSQVGMAIGLERAGWAGAAAAWVGFTLPSALLMLLAAWGLPQAGSGAWAGAVHGLKVVAVAVVAQAVWGMARTLCPDALRAGIALGAALLVLALPGVAGQLLAIGAGALVAYWAWRPAVAVAGAGGAPAAASPRGAGARTGAVLLGLAVLGLLALPIVAAATASPWWQAVCTFYRAGALVFGGGHVVLPLLEAGVVLPGGVSSEQFLAGYGAAQALPGPLFSIAAYLGALLPLPGGGAAGAAVMLLAMFAPGLLLMAGALPLWQALRGRAGMQRALAGVNAAVVGVLAAALVGPVWQGGIRGPADALLALAALVLLVAARVSPLVVVALAALGGAALAASG